MADITAKKDVQRQEGEVYHFLVEASEKILEGALVAVNADGYAINAGDDANAVFVGVAHTTADNTDGADGDVEVQVRTFGVIDVKFGGTATQADVGSLVYAVDNQTVDLAGVTTNDVLVGRVLEFVTATKVRVGFNTLAQ